MKIMYLTMAFAAKSCRCAPKTGGHRGWACPDLRNFYGSGLTGSSLLITRVIGFFCYTCRDWPFSLAPKLIDLGLSFQLHWAHMRLGFPAIALVGILNGLKYRETP